MFLAFVMVGRKININTKSHESAAIHPIERTMSKQHLLVSDDLTAINDPQNSTFSVLGEVLREQFQKIEEFEDFPAFGVWKIEVDCGLDKVQNLCPDDRKQVFRLVGDTQSLSRIGEWDMYSLPDNSNMKSGPILIIIDTLPDEPIRHSITSETA